MHYFGGHYSVGGQYEECDITDELYLNCALVLQGINKQSLECGMHVSSKL